MQIILFLKGATTVKCVYNQENTRSLTDKTGLEAVRSLENVSFSDVAKFGLENVRGEENEKSLGFTSL